MSNNLERSKQCTKLYTTGINYYNIQSFTYVVKFKLKWDY
jgi:hypothetical protein